MRKQAIPLRRAGHSIRAISERLGVPRSTVGGWLRGVQRPKTAGILAECELPGCGDLFFTTNPRRLYCCRQHTVRAAHAAARKRGAR